MSTTVSKGRSQALAGMLPSMCWLAAAATAVFLLRDDLPPVALALLALAAAFPAVLKLQKGWVKVLWADRIERARRKASASPADANAQYELGVLCALRGDDDEARAAYEAARRLDPGHAGATVGLGHMAADADHLDDALALFTAATEKDPNLFAAWFGVASVQLQREQFARAAAAYEKALKALPGDGFALAGLARCYFELGEHERAEQLVLEAAEHGVTDDDLARELRDAREE